VFDAVIVAEAVVRTAARSAARVLARMTTSYLSYVVRIKGSGTKEEFTEIHEAVMATSPNFYNVPRPVDLKPTLVVE
jgi:hypothetical protein